MAELSGPNRMAATIVATIADVEAALADATTRAERKQLNRALHRHRHMLDWCRSRAGYQPQETLAQQETGS